MKRIHVISNIIYLTKYIIRYAPSAFLLILLNAIFHSISIIINILGIKYVLDGFERGYDFNRMLKVVLVYTSIYLIVRLYFSFSDYFTSKLYSSISLKMDLDLMNKANMIDYSCYDCTEFYDTHTRAMKTAGASINNLISSYTAILSNLVAIISVSTLLVRIGFEYILISVFNVAISYFVIIRKNKKQYLFDKETTRINRETGYYKSVVFNPNAVKDIRANNANSFFIKKYSVSFSKWFCQFLKHKKGMTRFDALDKTSSSISLLLSMLLAVKDVLLGILSLGSYVSTINAVQSLSQQLSSLVFQLPNLIQQSKYIDNLKMLLDLPTSIEKDLETQSELVPGQNYKIEFSNVSFSYPNCTSKALDNVSFVIEPGDRIALVGENGAGKTTIIKLLLRLYDPQSGTIFINGVDVKKIKISNLRQCMAVVFQDTNIFATTVYENIAMDNSAEANSQKVLQVLKHVSLDKKILQQPNGLNTAVTRSFDERGLVFSGGEQQKIAICRAIYKQAGIILMDEPSSALDPNAEYELLSVLNESSNKHSAIIITHRLSLCTIADRIIVLQKGRIIEEGTHDELIQQDSQYKKVFMKQASSYIGDIQK